MKKLAIFGSGSGSNAENIYNYFRSSVDVKVVLICTNKKESFIVSRAEKLNIPVVFTSNSALQNFSGLKKTLASYAVDYVVLAGFLLKIPTVMIKAFPNRIINIHPSLLPDYGGKGMYGVNVYKAVLGNNEKEAGITIHFVNEDYDKGEIVLQKRFLLSKNETLDSLSEKIHTLEFQYYPKTIEKIILK